MRDDPVVAGPNHLREGDLAEGPAGGQLNGVSSQAADHCADADAVLAAGTQQLQAIPVREPDRPRPPGPVDRHP